MEGATTDSSSERAAERALGLTRRINEGLVQGTAERTLPLWEFDVSDGLGFDGVFALVRIFAKLRVQSLREALEQPRDICSAVAQR